MTKHEIPEPLLAIIHDIQEEESCLELGTDDFGNPFLIVESWEVVAEINGRLNGFTGLKKHFGPYNGQTLEDQRAELTAKLEASKRENPNHRGTHSRIENEIAAIDSHIAYRQHLANQNIEEPLNLDDLIEWGFSDEYSICFHCYDSIVRTSPDCYSWTPPYFSEYDGYVCSDCVATGCCDEEMLDNYANTTQSIPDDFDLDRLGLAQVNEDHFQNGWYGGQCDTPQPIIDAFNAESIDVWFKCYPGQFDVRFDVYVRSADLERATEILARTDVTADEDPAEVLKRGLQAATAATAALPDGGIKYATIDTTTGTATARNVSPEEFIDGIKRK